MQRLEHHTLGVRADYGATQNLGAPAATNLLPLRGAFAAAPPALQQPLIKLALLTSAAAQQLICSVWTNKHNNTSQWSCRMARTPSSCLGPGRSQLLGRLATLAQKRKSASCFWKFNKSSPGNVGLKKETKHHRGLRYKVKGDVRVRAGLCL